MVGMLVETVVVAFVMVGIISAITASHISNHQSDELKKVPIRINDGRKHK